MEESNNKMSFRLIWGIIMSIVYMAIGYFVIFTPLLLPYNFKDNLKENDEFQIVRIVLGLAMFAYGFFRGYRIFKFLKK